MAAQARDSAQLVRLIGLFPIFKRSVPMIFELKQALRRGASSDKLYSNTTRSGPKAEIAQIR